MREWLNQLKKLPLQKKKYILWGVTIAFAVILIIFWLFSLKGRFEKVAWPDDLSQVQWPEDNDTWSEINDRWSEWNIEDLFPEELEDAWRSELEVEPGQSTNSNIDYEQNREDN
jgi:hypothetical protein